MSEEPATYEARPPTEAEKREAEQDASRFASVHSFIEDRSRGRLRGHTANKRSRYEQQLRAEREAARQRTLNRSWFAFHLRQAERLEQLASEHRERARSLVGR